METNHLFCCLVKISSTTQRPPFISLFIYFLYPYREHVPAIPIDMRPSRSAISSLLIINSHLIDIYLFLFKIIQLKNNKLLTVTHIMS